ncbi:MAG: alpha/beta hydrolase-fold protein [Sphingomonas taxi]
MRGRTMLIAMLMSGAMPAPALAQADGGVTVALAPAIKDAQSGRLLIFAQRIDPAAKPDAKAKEADTVDIDAYAPGDTALAAREIAVLAPGEVATVDTATDVYPAAFATLPAGRYRWQAVLDRNHDYAYGGRGEGDLVSPVVETTLPGAAPRLVLTTLVPAQTMEDRLARVPEKERAAMRAAVTRVQAVDFTSPALSAFWGRPTHIRGWVALPPQYGRDGATYPTVFSTGGYGSTLASAQGSAARTMIEMAAGRMPSMIWVYLDESSPTGTHEFADSVNNGPWGEALTTEFLPWIEGRYAMDARAGSRFLTGHSSGGWATLWLQTRYPSVFGGTWSTSPDPSDFHEFTNVDIYAPDANAYVRKADGTEIPLSRDKGKVTATQRQVARVEQALGIYSGQNASFEWVFSPKGPDGRPLPLFDRTTGRIDPEVARYWRDHYDIAYRIQRDWPTLRSDLDGKIHVIVGTADTFYLDAPAHRLQAVLDGLGARSSFTYLPDKTHFDLFKRGHDRMALMRDIAWDMYATARPGTPPPGKAR